jgi:hypothetical protein
LSSGISHSVNFPAQRWQRSTIVQVFMQSLYTK